MLRKELLDARKALRNVREGGGGPRSRKRRGEWVRGEIKNNSVAHVYCLRWNN